MHTRVHRLRDIVTGTLTIINTPSHSHAPCTIINPPSHSLLASTIINTPSHALLASVIINPPSHAHPSPSTSPHHYRCPYHHQHTLSLSCTMYYHQLTLSCTPESIDFATSLQVLRLSSTHTHSFTPLAELSLTHPPSQCAATTVLLSLLTVGAYSHHQESAVVLQDRGGTLT